jgi:hypothetical protein
MRKFDSSTTGLTVNSDSKGAPVGMLPGMYVWWLPRFVVFRHSSFRIFLARITYRCRDCSLSVIQSSQFISLFIIHEIMSSDLEYWIYHERQEAMLCGQHALNNLVQACVFSPESLAELAVRVVVIFGIAQTWSLPFLTRLAFHVSMLTVPIRSNRTCRHGTKQ